MNDLSNQSAPSSSSVSSTEPSPSRDDAASALKSAVTADVHDLTDKAKDVAGGVVEHARHSVESQISGGKDRVAEGLGSVAEAMRQTGEHLRSQDKLGLTQYVASAADRVEAASGYLQERDLSDVLSDLGGFARREPALFLGGAFALGLLGGRFLKSSHVQPARTASPNNAGQGSSQNGAREGQQAKRKVGSPSRAQGNRSPGTARTLPGAGTPSAGSVERPSAAERFGEGAGATRNGAV